MAANLRRSVFLLLCLWLLPIMIIQGCSLLMGADEPALREGGIVSTGNQPAAVGEDAEPAVLRIGIVLPPGNEEGQTPADQARRGFALALDERGQAVGGAEVQLLEAEIPENQRSPAMIATAAERLIGEQRVHALLGGLTGELAMPVAVVAQSAATPFLALNVSGDPLVTGQSFVIPIAASHLQQGAAMARYARNALAATTAAVFYDITSPVSHDLARSFVEVFAEAGGTADPVTPFLPGALPAAAVTAPAAGEVPASVPADLKASLEKMAEEQPAVWYMPFAAEMAADIAAVGRGAGITAALLGSADWRGERLYAENQEIAPGATFVAQFHPDRADPVAEQFVAAYRDRYGTEPDPIAALAYDAMSRLLDAAAAAVVSERFDAADAAATRTALQAVLRQPGEYRGATGRWVIDAPGAARKTVHIVRVSPDRPPAVEYVREQLP